MRRRLTILAILLLLAGCGSGKPGPDAARWDSSRWNESIWSE